MTTKVNTADNTDTPESAVVDALINGIISVSNYSSPESIRVKYYEKTSAYSLEEFVLNVDIEQIYADFLAAYLNCDEDAIASTIGVINKSILECPRQRKRRVTMV